MASIDQPPNGGTGAVGAADGLPHHAAHPHSHLGETPRQRTSNPGWSMVAAAPAHSNITGLLAGFALTAVVLILTLVATAHLTPTQRHDLPFPAYLFAIGFLGGLLSAYALGSLSGEHETVATMTAAVLTASGASVSLMSVLGGFASLARLFLPDAAVAFIGLCIVAGLVAPIFVFFPLWDTVRNFGGTTAAGRPRDETHATKVIRWLWALCAIGPLAGLGIRALGSGGSNHAADTVFAVLALVFIAVTVIAGMLLTTAEGDAGRLTIKSAAIVAASQAILIAGLIALIP